MYRIKWILGILAVICAGVAIYFVLSSEHALIMNPKGIIARKELKLIGTNYFLMFIVIIPTFFFFSTPLGNTEQKIKKSNTIPSISTKK